jgi:hypothetical protein
MRQQVNPFLIGLVWVSFALHLWGIQGNLPFAAEIDEPVFVSRAIRMAATGDLNPRWFGHPGSTLIYPLAALYHLASPGLFLQPDPTLQISFKADPGEFYLFGRYLTIGYAVVSLPLVYQLGRCAFGRPAGLIGASLAILPVVAVAHSQMVRTDSAATFFGLLSLWLCLKVYDRPTPSRFIQAGLSIGLAIATRYFMVALVPILLVAGGLAWLQKQTNLGVMGRAAGLGLLGVGAGFALSTPYFFLDFQAALYWIVAEANDVHIDADGLSPLGNLIWYVTQAIPTSLTWPVAIFTVLGVAQVSYERQMKPLLLLGFAIIFILGLSLSDLHWQRWLIPVLPLLALFAAHGLVIIASSLALRLSWSPATRQRAGTVLLLLVLAWPGYQLGLHNLRQSNPSTRVLAREWILRNLPADSKIAQEWYSAALFRTGFDVLEQSSLAKKNRSPADLDGQGYNTLVVSSEMYNRYLAEAELYPAEVNFYQTLFREGCLLQQFEPTLTRGGPTVRIYRWQPC